jgi:hypothetical protein
VFGPTFVEKADERNSRQMRSFIIAPSADAPVVPYWMNKGAANWQIYMGFD